jgi:hypothetical protein
MFSPPRRQRLDHEQLEFSVEHGADTLLPRRFLDTATSEQGVGGDRQIVMGGPERP